jgi:HSP20 family protein
MWRSHACLEASERAGFTWQPPTNVYETAGGGLVHIEVAGLEPEDFRVVYADGTLSVSGTRRVVASPSAVAFYRMEIATGRFRTDVRVPWDVDSEAIRVDYRQGLLIILLPVRRDSGT